jgi:hypothetical protein
MEAACYSETLRTRLHGFTIQKAVTLTIIPVKAKKPIFAPVVL